MQNDAGKTALDLDLNVGSLVCYLNICLPIGLVYSIIVLVQDKTNKLPRFHAFQSLLVLAIAIVLSIGAWIVIIAGAIIDGILGTVGIVTILLGLVVGIVGLGLLILVVISAIKAFKGEVYKIPVIGNIADQWSN